MATSSKTWVCYRRLLRWARPYMGYLIIGVLGTLMMSGVDAFFAWLMKPIVNQVFDSGKDHWTRYLPLLIVVLFMIRGSGSFLSSYFTYRSSRFVVTSLREAVFERFLVLPMRFLERKTTAEHISLLVYNVEQLSDATSTTLVAAIQDFALVTGLLVTMLTVSWRMTLFILIVMPVIALLLRCVSKRMRRLSHQVQNTMSVVTEVIQECLHGMTLIRMSGTRKKETARFSEAVTQNRQQSLKISVTNALSSSVTQILLAIPISLIMLLVTEAWVDISAGEFASLMTAMIMLIRPIRRLSMTNSVMQKGLAGAESIFLVLDQKPELDEGKERSDQPDHWAIKDLTFAYLDAQTTLQSLNFTVKKGQVIGVVGASGCGKSTLLRVLAGIYAGYSGTILLDGVDRREYSVSSVRSQAAYVSQDSVVFNSTIVDNVVYGCEEGSEEKLWQCLEMAQIAQWVREQPDGLNTTVGEAGRNLSGGQRQRVAIARALYANTPILILDEATSALDLETEAALLRDIADYTEKKTVFVVAHRLSTIQHADNILVMDSGRLVEQGKHDQLLQATGRYAALYAMQFRRSKDGEASC